VAKSVLARHKDVLEANGVFSPYDGRRISASGTIRQAPDYVGQGHDGHKDESLKQEATEEMEACLERYAAMLQVLFSVRSVFLLFGLSL